MDHLEKRWEPISLPTRQKERSLGFMEEVDCIWMPSAFICNIGLVRRNLLVNPCSPSISSEGKSHHVDCIKLEISDIYRMSDDRY